MSDDALVFGRFLDEMTLLVEALVARLHALDDTYEESALVALLRDCVRLSVAAKDLAIAFDMADIAIVSAAIARAASNEPTAVGRQPVPLLGVRDAVAYLQWRLGQVRDQGAGVALDGRSFALVQSLEALIDAGLTGFAENESGGLLTSRDGGGGELPADEQAILNSFATLELRPRDPELDALALGGTPRPGAEPLDSAAQPPDGVDIDAIPVEMKRLFALETESDLQELSELIASYGSEPEAEGDPDRWATLAAMARIAHKIKGTAPTVGFPEFSLVAMLFERVVVAFQRAGAASEGQIEVVLGRFLELFEICLESASMLEAPNPLVIEEAEQLCDAVIQATDAIGVATDITAAGGAVSHSNASRISHGSEPHGRESLLRVDSARLDALMVHLSGLIVNRGSIAALRVGVARAQADMAVTIDRLHEKSAQIADAHPLGERAAFQARSSASRTAIPEGDRAGLGERSAFSGILRESWGGVERERSSEADTALRALTEVVADIETLNASFSGALMQMGQLIDAQEIVIANIQQDATRMRLAPLAELAPRLQVLASYLAVAERKQVRFSIEGEMTEIDRSLMRALAEPLNQLVRNAIVHGIESPEERRTAGKAETGSVWIHAYYAGSEVIIEVGDDGRGVNSHALVARAISKGALRVDEARGLSEEAALNLIFKLGLTTRSRSDALAGSGIGLNEAATLIRGLKGDISVRSSHTGTVFRIRAPMTLTVLPALEVTAGGQVFTAPFSSVVVSLMDVASGLRRSEPAPEGEDSSPDKPAMWLLNVPAVSDPLSADEASKASLTPADAPISGYSLAECLGLASDTPPGAAIVVERRGQQFALLVDAIGSMREMMVRPLPAHLKRRLIRGVTIRPDNGAMALLIDTGEVIDQRLAGADTPPHTTPARAPRPAPVARVLIVDDSVTIRRTLDQMLTEAGFSTALARDGYEALEMMEAELPRVIILDVEMPRLNGYELLSVMRSAPQYSQTRVVMLTSRAGANYEQHARELGADDYLVKPCPQDTLISVVRRMLSDSEPS